MQRQTRKLVTILASVAVAFAVIRFVGIFLRVRSDHAPALGGIKTISPADPLPVKMQKFGEEAVNIGHKSGAQLDYSVDSLDKVDSLLDLLSRDHAAGRVNDEDTMAGCLIWGAYVGEVIRKHQGGGEWAEGLDGTGHGTYPLTIGNKALYPCRWCVDRVSGGGLESVAKNYQSFALEQVVQAMKSRNNTNQVPSTN